jgi:hypothetical protein
MLDYGRCGKTLNYQKLRWIKPLEISPDPSIQKLENDQTGIKKVVDLI